MKSELKIAEKENRSKFPLLARSKHTGEVVLFIGFHEGVVVACPNKVAKRRMGEFNHAFIPVNDPNTWEILPSGSTVTLTQE